MQATVIFKDGREEQFPTQAAAERFAMYWVIYHHESITVRCNNIAKRYIQEEEIH